MKKKIIVLISILLTLFILFSLWWMQAVKPPNPVSKKSVTFIIKKGENSRGIAERLKKEGFIRSPLAFFILARFTDLADKLQAGQFLLSDSMDMESIANTLTHGTIDVKVTIPEGWRNTEIAIKLTQELFIPENEFLKVAREGYMFPDTYFFPKDASASTLVKIMLDNFNLKTAKFQEKKNSEDKLKFDDLVIIASLVEREAQFAQDRPMVASVILNRLNIGMKLDIDATIQYALGYQQGEKKWWKKELTLEDLDIKSVYNTYKNNGLPPTPISNPGLSAMEAVINATKTDYIYYISDKSGKIHLAKTIQEHNMNISKYLNK